MSLRDRQATRRARRGGDNQPAESDGGSRISEDADEPGEKGRDNERGRRAPIDRSLRASNHRSLSDHDDDSQDKRDAPDGLEEKPRPIRDRGSKNTPITEENEEQSTPTQPKDKNHLEKEIENGPLRILEPLRTDPLGPMKSRIKNFERLAAQSLPEIHFIGNIVHGEDMLQDPSDGCCCR